MVGWLIDGKIFSEYRDKLVAAIQLNGYEAKLITAPNPPFRWDDVGCSYRETFPENSCVVAHGDIEFCSRIYRDNRWTPGAFCTIENFYCSNYSCYFGQHMLNSDYIMLPFGELDRRKDFLFSTVGRDDQIFVRPDSPLKLFTGQVVTRATFEKDLEFMAFYEFPQNEIVIVTKPVNIVCEWRFVIANGKVVTGCQYKDGDEFDSQPSIDKNAHAFASSIAQLGYEPDPVWTADICKTDDDRYHLLEIGGFSFSDLYSCDMEAVVPAVSKVANKLCHEAQEASF